VDRVKRLEDTEAISLIAISHLQPRLDALRSYKRALEEQCVPLRKVLQHDVENLEGEFVEALASALREPLQQQASVLQGLAGDVHVRQRLISELRIRRAELSAVLGRPATFNQGKCDKLQADVENLQRDIDRRRDQILEYATTIRAILDELRLPAVENSDTAIFADKEFGLTDSDFEVVLARVAFWETRIKEWRKMRQTALKVRVLWKELGELPSTEDATVEGVIDGVASRCIIDVDYFESIVYEVESRLAVWEEKKTAAVISTKRVHAALRSFGGNDLAEEIISKYGGAHLAERAECKRRLREMQVDIRAAEALDRHRLAEIYDITGAENAMEEFDEVLDEVETVALRKRVMANELKRLEDYLASLIYVLRQMEELKSLALEGSQFERAANANENRFNGKSVHFLQEEKFRKMFSKRYPQLRDTLIRDLGVWEGIRSPAIFVFHGCAMREQLLEMRRADSSMPGHLGVVSVLLQLFRIAPGDAHLIRAERASRAANFSAGTSLSPQKAPNASQVTGSPSLTNRPRNMPPRDPGNPGVGGVQIARPGASAKMRSRSVGATVAASVRDRNSPPRASSRTPTPPKRPTGR